MSTRNFPYGYKMEQGIIKVDEAEAKYVRMIFELRMSGMGVYAIGKMLYDKQIPFFDDTRDKAIKKASAILYKPIYAGDKKYPPIVDKELFDKVQEMKSAAFRKEKSDKKDGISDENEDYELIPCQEVENIRADIEKMIESHSADSTSVKKAILEFAAKKYSCIKRKEEN